MADGFLILSERQATVADAKALAQTMKAAGVDDLFVFGSGPSAGLVSLGVYSDERGARRRQDVLAGLGFDTELHPRTTSEAEYWLDVELPAGATTAALESDPILGDVPVASADCDKRYTARD